MVLGMQNLRSLEKLQQLKSGLGLLCPPGNPRESNGHFCSWLHQDALLSESPIFTTSRRTEPGEFAADPAGALLFPTLGCQLPFWSKLVNPGRGDAMAVLISMVPLPQINHQPEPGHTTLFENLC